MAKHARHFPSHSEDLFKKPLRPSIHQTLEAPGLAHCKGVEFKRTGRAFLQSQQDPAQALLTLHTLSVPHLCRPVRPLLCRQRFYIDRMCI